MKYFIFTVFLLISSISVASESLVLQENRLGSLILSETTKVSEKILANLFPEYLVSHEVRSGDSPDFHFFEVKKSNETIFTIKSFDGVNGFLEDKEVTIGILEVYSPLVKDKHGISVGMSYLDVIRTRGEELKFGASHFTNFIGESKIWYGLSGVEKTESNGVFEYPVGVEKLTQQDVEDANPKVRVISWPMPSWE